jgi:putative alpha-1,2-mannosidase
MGGDASAVAKLNTFFTQLNAGRYQPYDWAGNEPSLWTPWEYDYFGAPWRTQDVVRRIATTLYSARPDDEPGNDDLGAISSWYVWAAIGLFPVTPGAADLALASPLFPRVVLTLPDNHTLVLEAPTASAATPLHPLLASVTANPGGRRRHRALRPESPRPPGRGLEPTLVAVLHHPDGGTLTYALSATPDSSWGAAPGDSPPSFATGRLPAVGYSVPSGGTTLRVGRPTTIQTRRSRRSVQAGEHR